MYAWRISVPISQSRNRYLLTVSEERVFRTGRYIGFPQETECLSDSYLLLRNCWNDFQSVPKYTIDKWNILSQSRYSYRISIRRTFASSKGQKRVDKKCCLTYLHTKKIAFANNFCFHNFLRYTLHVCEEILCLWHLGGRRTAASLPCCDSTAVSSKEISQY